MGDRRERSPPGLNVAQGRGAGRSEAEVWRNEAEWSGGPGGRSGLKPLPAPYNRGEANGVRGSGKGFGDWWG